MAGALRARCFPRGWSRKRNRQTMRHSFFPLLARDRTDSTPRQLFFFLHWARKQVAQPALG